MLFRSMGAALVVEEIAARLQWGHERALVEIHAPQLNAIRQAEASMGPRARARGNSPECSRSLSDSKLQWGHERALVEILWSATRLNWISSLQWGHERALVEIPSHPPALIEAIEASMGPRARARGNEGWEFWGENGHRASMGPRARARGNKWTRLCPSRQGLCFNGATSARSWK